MSEVQSRTSPIVAIAAVAVIIFSVVGVGVMTGVIPSSRSTDEMVQKPDANTVQAPKAAPGQASAGAGSPAKEVQKPATQAAVKQPARVASAPAPVTTAPAPAAAQSPAPAPVVATPPVAAPAPVVASAPAPVAASAPAPRVCAECGVIDSINVVEQKGQGSGLGAVGGAVVGGLLGNQVGSGRGNTAATVVGAVGGAVAGNEVERRVKTTKQYDVTVRMDDGNIRKLTFDNAPPYVVGEKVKVIDGKLVKG